MLDYDGLKKVQEYREQELEKKLKEEEKLWLKGCESICGNTGIDIAKIGWFFQTQIWDKSSGQASGRNFVGKHWISDSDMDTQFDVANKQYTLIQFALLLNQTDTFIQLVKYSQSLKLPLGME